DDLDDDDPVALERTRTAGIATLCAKYTDKVEPVKLGKIQAKGISDGWDQNRVELELIKAQRPEHPTLPASGAPMAMVRADRAAMGSVLEASLCLSGGLKEKFVAAQYGERVVDAASSAPYRNASLHTVLLHVIQAAGMPMPQRIDNEAIRTAFQADQMIRG